MEKINDLRLAALMKFKLAHRFLGDTSKEDVGPSLGLHPEFNPSGRSSGWCSQLPWRTGMKGSHLASVSGFQISLVKYRLTPYPSKAQL